MVCLHSWVLPISNNSVLLMAFWLSILTGISAQPLSCRRGALTLNVRKQIPLELLQSSKSLVVFTFTYTNAQFDVLHSKSGMQTDRFDQTFSILVKVSTLVFAFKERQVMPLWKTSLLSYKHLTYMTYPLCLIRYFLFNHAKATYCTCMI